MPLRLAIETKPPRTPPPPLVDRELTLQEMLADPIVIRLMARDGVTRSEVIALFETGARGRLCLAA